MMTLRKYWLGNLLVVPALVACGAQDDATGDGETTAAANVQNLQSGHSPSNRPGKGADGCRAERHQFAVFSDPHLYDTALGTEGAAFEAYMTSDRKMLVQSEAILNQVVERTIAERPEFVLVPGDLTKDGERQDHLEFAGYMKRLEHAGIEVFVVPGNHDVSNPDAVRYTADAVVPVKNVDEREFAKIYREFGYAEAIDRDTDSLSYLAEPTRGVWLLAIDSTIHRDNTPETGPVTAGRLSATTRAWALSKLKLAKRMGKRVIGMMHHGLLEHYAGQTIIFPDYVVEDCAALSKQLADAGLPVVFTGHFHANDVTSARWDNGSHLSDVETGSLVTAPSPFRFVDYYPREQQMIITTEHVTELPNMPNFESWAAQFLDDGIRGLVMYQLMSSGLADAATAQAIAPVIATALEAHYAGDEPPPDAAAVQVASMLRASGSPVGQAWAYSLISLHTDLAPSDNDLVLNLGTQDCDF